MEKRKLLRDLPQLCAELDRDVFELDDRFPHVSAMIAKYWGIPELFNPYAKTLIEHVPTVDRPTREGFPPKALFEIGDIAAIHAQLFPAKVEVPFELEPPALQRRKPKPKKKGLLSRLFGRQT